jgi:phosphatidate cytidylyltransferase
MLIGIYLQNTVKPLAYIAALGGVFYISFSCGLMIDLFEAPIGFTSESPAFYASVMLPMIILFSIWINDTMAYIVGSLIGKTPLSKISPKNMGRYFRRYVIGYRSYGLYQSVCF